MADLPGGCRACHAKLEDGCLGGVGGRGIGLEREAPTTVALTQVEVQDAGLAHAGPACQLCHWGDNVVWVWEGSETHQQLFYDAIAQRRDDFGAAGYVAVSSDP